MDNKQFLVANPLELEFPKHNVPLIEGTRAAIKKANESYIVDCKEEETTGFIRFTITIPTTTFAVGYYHLGQLMAPVIKEHFKLT